MKTEISEELRALYRAKTLQENRVRAIAENLQVHGGSAMGAYSDESSKLRSIETQIENTRVKP